MNCFNANIIHLNIFEYTKIMSICANLKREETASKNNWDKYIYLGDILRIISKVYNDGRYKKMCM